MTVNMPVEAFFLFIAVRCYYVKLYRIFLFRLKLLTLHMRKSRNRNSFRNTITLLAYVIILSSMTISVMSCHRLNERNEATQIKEYTLKNIEGDSSAYTVPFRAEADSISALGPKGMDRALLHLANSMMLSGHHLKAIKMLEGRRRMLESKGKSDRNSIEALLAINVCLGAAYDETGMPGLGLDCYSRGLRIANDTSTLPYRAMLLNNIGVLYCKSQSYEEAKRYFKQALDINLKQNKRNEIALNYNNLAEIYNLQKEYPAAIDASLKSLQYLDSEKKPETFYYTHLFLGLLYTRTGEFEIALSYLRNGLSRLNDLHSVPGTIEAYERLSESFRLMGKLDSTELYARKALNLARQSNLHPMEKSSLVTLANTYKAQGKFQQAADCFEMSAALADSLHNEESKLRLQEWSARSEMEMDSDTDTRTFSLSDIVIYSLLLLTLATGFVVMMTDIIRKRRNQKRIQDKVEELNREISEATAEIDRLNREQTANALDKMKMHEGLESICDDVRTIINDGGIKSSSIMSRHRELLEKLNQLSVRIPDDFKHYFEKVHPAVYKTLEERCPTLTQRDLRLCGFIVLGLSTKEIASLTFREVRSVESARNRLKKKLGLDASTDLSDYLRSLTHQ